MLVLLFLPVICTICFYINLYNQKRALEKKQELEYLYRSQNIAFEVCTDYTQCIYYHGADELKLNRIIVDLYVYNISQTQYQLSIDEVINYFDGEYDSDGKLKVYSRPENIENYIIWFAQEESTYLQNFDDNFNEYLMEHGYPHVYRNMSYEEVVDALEIYKNDPEYVPPWKVK